MPTNIIAVTCHSTVRAVVRPLQVLFALVINHKAHILQVYKFIFLHYLSLRLLFFQINQTSAYLIGVAEHFAVSTEIASRRLDRLGCAL